MDITSPEATADLLATLDLPPVGSTSDFLLPPHPLSPLRYIGLGDCSSLPRPVTLNVLRFDATAPTSVIEPVRNLLTGDIESFRDAPIATFSIDEGAINRPLANFDDYQRGSSFGVAFTPGGLLTPSTKSVPIPDFLASLDSGLNLLSTPFAARQPAAPSPDQLPALPDAPGVTASPLPKPRAQLIPESTAAFAITDTWDHTQFAATIPNPALTFSYPLDPFQLRAIHRL
jgi:hypothetical protein